MSSAVRTLSPYETKFMCEEERVALFLPGNYAQTSRGLLKIEGDCEGKLNGLGVEYRVQWLDPYSFPFIESLLPIGWKAYENEDSSMHYREVVLLDAEDLPKAIVGMNLQLSERYGYVDILSAKEASEMKNKVHEQLDQNEPLKAHMEFIRKALLTCKQEAQKIAQATCKLDQDSEAWRILVNSLAQEKMDQLHEADQQYGKDLWTPAIEWVKMQRTTQSK